MVSKILGCFYILLLSSFPLTAGADDFVDIVESSLGDKLEIRVIPTALGAPHIIETCLIDETGGGAKGFDIRQDQPPRFVSLGHQPVCAQLFASAHQLVFWRATLGGFIPVVSLPIDLSGHTNEQLWITWRLDGALATASIAAPPN